MSKKVRIGKVSTVAPALRGMCLDALVERDEGVKAATKELYLNQQGSLGWIEAWAEVGKRREQAAVSILKATDVVVASLIGEGPSRALRSRPSPITGGRSESERGHAWTFLSRGSKPLC